MKTEKHEQLINDKGHSRAEELADLPVTDEQADETKGGTSGTGKTMAAEVLAHDLRLDQ